MSENERGYNGFKAILSFYASALSNAPDFSEAHIVSLWWDEFKNVPASVFKNAFREHMRTSVFYPRFSEMIAAIKLVSEKSAERALAAPERLALTGTVQQTPERVISKDEWDGFNSFLQGKRPYPEGLPPPDPTKGTFAFRVQPDHDPQLRQSEAGVVNLMRRHSSELKSQGWDVDDASDAEIQPYAVEDERAHVKEVRYSGTFFMRGTIKMFETWKAERPKAQAEATVSRRFKL